MRSLENLLMILMCHEIRALEAGNAKASSEVNLADTCFLR